MNLALPPGLPLRLCSAALEIPPLPPERLLALGAEPTAAFLAPDGESWVGMGAARWLAGEAGDTAALWAGLADLSPEAPPPSALGALPFRRGEVADALWSGLMPGGVVLPERLVVQRGGRAWLRLTLPAQLADTLHARLAEAAAEIAALAPAEAAPLPGFEDLDEGAAPGGFSRAVGEAVRRIRAGELVKVVLARRAGIRFDRAPSAAAVLRRLSQHQPAAVRYAWCRGGKAWLGATPETLLRLDGRLLRTEALAGTRPEALADELHADTKERHEHAVVVDAVRAAIAPWVQALPPLRTPGLRRTRGLAHLHTPIEATLRADADALALVRALHPTPAVCGLPTEAAAALLAALEGEPRGLYAGPVLRLSADGSAHAVVALRGAVLAGRNAVLPAGAGIVDGSDGERELAETRAKQHSVLDAWRRVTA
ncbi:isochorismate synthase [Rubrivivax gelatinosus]|uniref:isochorismate synthase n=1 Tax=Rubrivivax gelatinosus TaxID=28068 RepID=A0ABS1E221_RUBGE|nr:isochorismate synthase [Rubrivivax gelatinosus]MBK1715915.1 isochorismate synthase [Rubrivivax gelatinosus]